MARDSWVNSSSKVRNFKETPWNDQSKKKSSWIRESLRELG
jgi:hypothetical protein